jgi:hypothetical protein
MDAGLERSLLLFIKQDHYLKVMRATVRSRVILRKAGQVELFGETPNRLGAEPILQDLSDGCQYYLFRERKNY